jgi:hypothetical protein
MRSCLHIKYRYYYPILMKLCFSQQVFGKYLNIKFHETLPSGSRVVPCRRTEGRTDRYYDANSHFSRFCERALRVTLHHISSFTSISLPDFQNAFSRRASRHYGRNFYLPVLSKCRVTTPFLQAICNRNIYVFIA